MKRTYQPNNSKKSKKQGFLKRQDTKVNKNRRAKGRKKIAI